MHFCNSCHSVNNYVVDRSRTRRLCRSAGCCFSLGGERDNEVWRVVAASTGPAPRSRMHAKRASFPQSSSQGSRRNLKPIETEVSNGRLVGLPCSIACRQYVRCTIAVLQRRGPCDKKKNIQVFKLSNNEHVKGNRIKGGGGGGGGGVGWGGDDYSFLVAIRAFYTHRSGSPRTGYSLNAS